MIKRRKAVRSRDQRRDALLEWFAEADLSEYPSDALRGAYDALVGFVGPEHCSHPVTIWKGKRLWCDVCGEYCDDRAGEQADA